MPGGPEYPVLGGVESKTGAGVGQGAPFSQGFPHSTQGAVSTPTVLVPFLASRTTVYPPFLQLDQIAVPFLASHTTVYPPSIQPGTQARLSQEVVEALVRSSAGNAMLSQIAVEALRSTTTGTNAGVSQLVVEVLVQHREVFMPFLGPHTTVWPPTLTGVALQIPFLPSRTHVWSIMSMFEPGRTFGGPGNGGEAFSLRLAANGSSVTATLLTDVTAAGRTLNVTGDGSWPSDRAFPVYVDAEEMLLSQIAPGQYQIRLRALGNTLAASHSAGASATWGDSYDQAITAGNAIAHSFTADINSTGSFTYPGWLICFDSSQAYLGGDRYPMHVTQMLGVFDAGAGSSGSSRCDGPQPSAIHTPVGVSDDCPAALTNPARIASDINVGDVAVLRYTNPEASVLDLGPRSAALQSWFGLKRVSTSDVDVTFTDPNGIVVDTTGTYDTFTGSVNGEWPDPVPLVTGIAPDASDAAGHAVPTPQPVPWTTVTLPGIDRHFTYGSGGGGYNEKGWPMCCLAVRQGNRRVPFWQSWDWHDYAYVYAGFGTDDTYAQLLINRNGIVFGSLPVVELPGPQDIDGPDAVWDDGTYFFGASWYVAIFAAPYIVFGPVIGGAIPPGGGSVGGVAPEVGFGGGTTPGGPVVTTPPSVEGGSGGDIAPGISGLHVWSLSGGFQ